MSEKLLVGLSLSGGYLRGGYVKVFGLRFHRYGAESSLNMDIRHQAESQLDSSTFRGARSSGETCRRAILTIWLYDRFPLSYGHP